MDTEMEVEEEEKPSKRTNGKLVDPAQNVAADEALSINDWLKSTFSGEVAVKIKLYRNAPNTFNGTPTKGYLTEFSELVTEDQIKEIFGGGVYRIHTWRMDAQGNWKTAGTKVFTIAGNPKIDEASLPRLVQNGINAGAIPAPIPTTASDKAIDVLTKITHDERQRADKIAEEMRSHKQVDPDLMQTIVAPYQSQIEQLSKTIASLQDQLTGALNRKPDTAFQDKLLDKMIDGEGVRLNALRDQHASELRTLKESHAEELKRREAHWERREERAQQNFDRELSTLKTSSEREVKSIEIAYAGRIDGLNMQIATLKSSLDEARQELVALRSQKDEGPLEQLQKMVTLRDAFKNLGGDDDEGPAEPSTFDKIAAAAGPLIEGISQRLAAGPQPAQVVGQPQLEAPQQEAAPAAQNSLGVTRSELMQAVGFVENAIKNSIPPATFAQGARSQIPGSILEAIKTHGVDNFINSLPLIEGSPLRTVAGKSYLRAVIKILVEPQE